MLSSSFGNAVRSTSTRFSALAQSGASLQLARLQNTDPLRMFEGPTPASGRWYSQASSPPTVSTPRPPRHPVAAQWDEHAARLNIFQLLTNTSEQRDGCAQLFRPSRRAISHDPLTLAMLGGRKHELDHVLSGHGPGVAESLRLLGLGQGHKVALVDPHDLRLAVHLAMLGCDCSIVSGHEMLTFLAEAEVEDCQNGWYAQVLATTGEKERASRESIEHARQVASRMTVVACAHPASLPPQGSWHALMALSVFQRYPTVDAIARDVLRAGTLLQPGGGLVFQFPHAAGSPMHPMDDPRPVLPSFGDIVDAAQRAQLQLRCVHITYRHMRETERVFHSQRLTPSDNGLISFRNADEAAWAGWEKVFKDPELQGKSLQVEVSGMLVRSTRNTAS